MRRAGPASITAAAPHRLLCKAGLKRWFVYPCPSVSIRGFILSEPNRRLRSVSPLLARCDARTRSGFFVLGFVSMFRRFHFLDVFLRRPQEGMGDVHKRAHDCQHSQEDQNRSDHTSAATSLELAESSSGHRQSQLRCSVFGVRCSVFGVWCSVFDVRCLGLGVSLGFGFWALVIRLRPCRAVFHPWLLKFGSRREKETGPGFRQALLCSLRRTF